MCTRIAVVVALLAVSPATGRATQDIDAWLVGAHSR